MLSKKSIIIASLLSITACSAKHNLMQERQRTGAPQNAQDVGSILEGADSQQVNAILEANPQAKVRVLNTEHGMYEIFGASENEIRREFSGPVERNQFFTLHKKNVDQADLFSTGLPPGAKIADLAPCQAGTVFPTSQISAEAPSAQLSTIELGQTVKLNGLKSVAPEGDSEPLKMIFAVMGPESSRTPRAMSKGSVLEFTPDALGLYRVFLAVQDSKGVCAMDDIQFLVTANRPYNGPSAPAMKADLSKFKHLAMVHAEEAWQLSRGAGVTIAIIDTGVNYNHPSLAPNIVVNDKDIPANQIDDEGNGFVDDYAGYDFVNQDGYPYDDDSHGTHVAGLAASKQFGLAPDAKLLVVKALTSVGGDVGTIAAAIRYAVDRGANIVNLSLGAGGAFPHPALISAINYAEQKGVLLVIAAGNGDPQTGLGFDLEKIAVWPASLRNEDILSVAAFDANNVLSTYSNFGAVSVDVVAPGGGEGDPMYSCAFENPADALLVGMDGTSMATPVTAGIAADVWSKHPGLSFKDVKEILISSGTEIPALKPITVSGKHIDALSALQLSADKNVLF